MQIKYQRSFCDDTAVFADKMSCKTIFESGFAFSIFFGCLLVWQSVMAPSKDRYFFLKAFAKPKRFCIFAHVYREGLSAPQLQQKKIFKTRRSWAKEHSSLQREREETSTVLESEWLRLQDAKFWPEGAPREEKEFPFLLIQDPRNNEMKIYK